MTSLYTLRPYVIWFWSNPRHPAYYPLDTLAFLMFLNMPRVSLPQSLCICQFPLLKKFPFSVADFSHPSTLRSKTTSSEMPSLNNLYKENVQSLSHFPVYATQYIIARHLVYLVFHFLLFTFNYWNVSSNVGNLFCFSQH